MKLTLLLFPILLYCGAAEGRAWTQGECKALALIAGQTAAYRTNQIPLPEVRKALRHAADNPEPGGQSVVRLPGDYELIEELVVAAYNSSYTGEQIYAMVWTHCDKGGNSRFIHEVRHVD